MSRTIVSFVKQKPTLDFDKHILTLEALVQSKRRNLRDICVCMLLMLISGSSFIFTVAMAIMFSTVFPETSKAELYLTPSILLFITLLFALVALYKSKQYGAFQIIEYEVKQDFFVATKH